MQQQSVVKSQGGQASSETDKFTKDGSTNGLKLIFKPCTTNNPYQKLLIEHLVKLGVQIGETNSRTSSLIRGQLPDVLHLHWLHYTFSTPNKVVSLIRTVKFMSGLILIRLMGVKIVWTAHNLKDHENRYPILDRICTTLVTRLAHGIIAHCEVAKSEVATQFHLQNRDKIFVVPHGNYIDYYENKINKAEARKVLGIADSCLLFLFLGSIRAYKGVNELIKTFKQLPPEGVQLVIAGKPLNTEDTELLRQEISGHDNIKLLPVYVSDDQIQVYMNACDVVVFPYRDILTSGAVILAMSFGRACIAPRMGCIGETLDDSGAFLYHPEAEDGLLQAMKRAIEQKAHLQHMGESNRQLAEKWQWSKVAEMTLNVYRWCLSH